MRLNNMKLERDTLKFKLAAAEERLAGGEEVLASMERLRDQISQYGYNTAAVTQVLDGLRANQRSEERERDRYKGMVTNSPVFLARRSQR